MLSNRFTLRARSMLCLLLLVALLHLAALTPAADAAGIACSQYGVNKECGGGWEPWPSSAAGNGHLDRERFPRYEVLIRVNYGSRALVDRTGLVVGATVARYGLGGQIMGSGFQVWTNVRPGFGKPNPFYVHTTITAKQGTELKVAAAAANGPQLVFWGPEERCTVD